MSIERSNKILMSVADSIAGLYKRFPCSSMLITELQRHLPWERSQTTQPQQVIGRTHKVGVQLHAGNATKARATQSAPALHPAEDFLDPLALSLADPVALMPSRTGIEPWGIAALDLRNVRADAPAAKEVHKRLAVIAPAATETRRLQTLAGLALEQLCRRSRLALEHRAHADVHAQPVAVLHERVSAKAQLGFLAGALAGRECLRITGRSMRIVGALRAAEIHSAPTIRRRWRTVFGLEALLSRPRLDQRAVHGQVLRGEQTFLASELHDRIEEALRQVLVHQSLAQAREVRLVEPRVLQTHVQEPAEQNVVVEHLAEQPVRAHRVQCDQQLPLQQPLRRNRGPASLGVKRVELTRQLLQHSIGVCLDATQRVIAWYSRLGREVAEHLRLRVDLSTHPFRLPVASTHAIL